MKEWVILLPNGDLATISSKADPNRLETKAQVEFMAYLVHVLSCLQNNYDWYETPEVLGKL